MQPASTHVAGRHFADFVLLALATLGPSHGPAIAQWLSQSLPGGMQPDLPGLYRTLQALEAQGDVQSRWATGSGPARHVYTLTAQGCRTLESRADAVRRGRDNLQFFLDQMARLVEGGRVQHA